MKSMSLNQRIFLAVTVICVEVITFLIPILALFAAYVLIARPLWFKNRVERLYEDPRKQER